MPFHKWVIVPAAAWALAATWAAGQMTMPMPNTTTRPMHGESEAMDHSAPSPTAVPPLPEGMTLEQVLDRAAQTPPKDFPHAIHDDRPYAFTRIEQLEYRAPDRGQEALGWRAKGWIGYDLDKFWWKSEGQAAFVGKGEGESENDLLYARLITPFWYAQLGAQYANDWKDGQYSDRWSGVLAIEGTAPYMFDVDASLYLSDRADLTAKIETTYDLRLTQRLVLQPRAEVRLAAQDVPQRNLGAGLNQTDLELRLRYEFKREFAPYIGVRYSFKTGKTADLAERAGSESEQTYFVAGVRLAF